MGGGKREDMGGGGEKLGWSKGVVCQKKSSFLNSSSEISQK